MKYPSTPWTRTTGWFCCRLFWVLMVGLLVSLLERRASAQVAPQLSEFEAETVRRALDCAVVFELAPEGKIVESIQIVPEDVFDERDPVPDILNVVHTTTRQDVVRRELLVAIGDHYEARYIEQSARNLRAFPWLSLVVIVATKGSTPDRVKVVVITRDIWSLRFNTNLQSRNGQLNYLALNPSENNFLGLHARAGGRFILDPGTYSFGGFAAYPRVAGSRINASAEGNAIVNRDTGNGEGSFGGLSIGQPLFAFDVAWAYGLSVFWRNEITRRYVDLDVATFDAVATPDVDDAIPILYDTQRVAAGIEGTRSFGLGGKYDLSLGFEVDVREYEVPANPEVDPRAQAEFILAEVPVSDTRIGPYLELRAHRSEFFTTVDLELLGLQENYALGHEAVGRVYPAWKRFGSSRNLIGIYAGLSYTLGLGDGLVRGLAISRIEHATVAERDAVFEASLRIATPRLGFGRFVSDAVLQNRYQNYLRRQYTLGGDDRLRGYPTGAFVGDTLVASNLEFRSTSIGIASARVGFAAFYDVGDAAESLAALDLKQAVGVGVRLLLPQLSRLTLRADYGVPVVEGKLDLPGGFFLTFEQAFPLPALRSRSISQATELIQIE